MRIEVHRTICNHCHNRFYELDGEQKNCPHCFRYTGGCVDDGIAATHELKIDAITGKLSIA